MTAEVIPFPKRPDPNESVSISMAGPNIFLLGECTDVIHFFSSLGGPCKCGKEQWPTKDAS